MPVAMAALDVAGQLRERSPIDLAIFGDEATRLTDRFVEPAGVQSLLARAVSDGNAEGTAWLNTSAGQRRFRISLWRQRGGERVRVLAAFSACGAAERAADRIAGQPGEAGLPAAACAALIHTAYDLRAPLTAVIGFAERIRSGAATLKPTETIAHAADIVAAAWRLVRLAEDLETAGTSGDTRPDLRMGEVDIARLVRRVARLAAPAAEAAGVTFNGHGLPERGKAPLVIADESALWSVIDSLLQNAVRHAGRGAAVAITLGKPAHGLALEIADNGPGLDSEALAGILEGGNRGMGPATAWPSAASWCGPTAPSFRSRPRRARG